MYKLNFESPLKIGDKVFFADPAGYAKIFEGTVHQINAHIRSDETEIFIFVKHAYDTGYGVTGERITQIHRDKLYATKELCANATMQMMLL